MRKGPYLEGSSKLARFGDLSFSGTVAAVPEKVAPVGFLFFVNLTLCDSIQTNLRHLPTDSLREIKELTVPSVA